jgi:penicillin-binding protein 2
MAGISERLGAVDAILAPRLRRIVVLIVALVVLFGVLVWQLVGLQLVRGGYYEQLANLNQIRTIPVTAPRGVMYDRSGLIVARNRPSFVVEVVPLQLSDPHREMAQLSRIVGIPESRLWKRLLQQNGVTYADFAALADAVPLGPVIIAEDLRPQIVARFAEQSDKLSGMNVELVPVRQYPHGTVGSHVLGYVGQITQAEYAVRRRSGYGANDVVGEDGLEFAYDASLRGHSGGRRIKVNSAGAAVATYPAFDPLPGNGLDLTIDWRLQQAAERAMAAQIRLLAASIGHRIGGAAVVEDPNSGAILALVSQPNFDPNDFAVGISAKKYAAYVSDPLHPLFDRAISGSSPTGSTFKLVTSSAALATGVLTPQSTRVCGGAFWLGDFVFNDDAAGGHGTLTVPEAISRSCDVFFYQVGHQLGIEKLDRFAAIYGIGRHTGVDSAR